MPAERETRSTEIAAPGSGRVESRPGCRSDRLSKCYCDRVRWQIQSAVRFPAVPFGRLLPIPLALGQSVRICLTEAACPHEPESRIVAAEPDLLDEREDWFSTVLRTAAPSDTLNNLFFRHLFHARSACVPLTLCLREKKDDFPAESWNNTNGQRSIPHCGWRLCRFCREWPHQFAAGT